MDIEKILKQLHTIEPDPDYTARSRVRILGEEKRWTLPYITPRRMLARAFEAGTAIALAGVLVFLILGGFSAWQRPGGVAGLDPAALRVEAQAIDTQIKLVDLDYAGLIEVTKSAGGGEEAIVSLIEDNEDSEATSTEATIDDVLRALAE